MESHMISRYAIGQKLFTLLTFTILVAGVFWISSCNITSPLPFNNTLAHKPALNQWAIHGISPGQIVTGTVTASIDSLPADLKVAQVELMYSTSYRSIASRPPYRFTINSGQMREGLDTLTFFVALGYDSSLGLLNGLSEAGFTISIPVVVDNNPPTKTQGVHCVWTDHPVLTWSPNQDSNFRGYIVRRYWPFIPTGNSVLDTIYDRQTTTFTDTTVEPVYGNLARYAVDTWDGAIETQGDTVTATCGGATLSTQGYCEWIIENPVIDQLYLSIGGSVYSYSTVTNTLLNSTSNLGAAPQTVLTPDGSTLVSFNPNSSVIKRDSVSNFAPWTDVTINSPNSNPMAMAADNSRFFIAAPSGSLEMVDAGTGNILSSVTGVFVSTGGQLNAVMVLSPDDRTLYCACDNRLYEFDVSSDNLGMTAQRTLTSFISHIYTVPGMSLIAVQGGNGIEFLDPGGLSDSGASIQLPSSTDIISCAFKPGKAYVAEWSVQQVYGYGSVVEYDLPSCTVSRQWTFTSHDPMDIAVSHSGQYLYVMNQSSGNFVVWVVPLQ